jgi:hypothetical protein
VLVRHPQALQQDGAASDDDVQVMDHAEAGDMISGEQAIENRVRGSAAGQSASSAAIGEALCLCRAFAAFALLFAFRGGSLCRSVIRGLMLS